MGPLIAIMSFVCSVGNVPLAAVLWSGGIGFAGVIAFIFADLLVLPIIAIYRKYYGGVFATRMVALMFVTIVISALIVDLLFGWAGLIPEVRPTRADIFSAVKVDYRLFMNAFGLLVFATLMGLTMRRGATDPVCGMRVDRSKAIRVKSRRHPLLLLASTARTHTSTPATRAAGIHTGTPGTRPLGPRSDGPLRIPPGRPLASLQ